MSHQYFINESPKKVFKAIIDSEWLVRGFRTMQKSLRTKVEGTVLDGRTVLYPRNGSLLKVEHYGFPVEERWVDLYGGAEWVGPILR
ncbi:MAG: hypothetical protein ACRECH_05850 [Nitrososphaerales archaeon]